MNFRLFGQTIINSIVVGVVVYEAIKIVAENVGSFTLLDLSNVSNIGLFVTTLLTLIIVWLTYVDGKRQEKHLRTLTVMSRFTGGSDIQKNMNILINVHDKYTSLMISGLSSAEDAAIIDSVFSYFEELGMYVEKNLIDWDIVYSYFSIQIPKLYSRYEEAIRSVRTSDNAPEAYEYFERLSNKILEKKKSC